MSITQDQTLSQDVEQKHAVVCELFDSGVLHVESVYDACVRDAKRKERVARRYNRTACAKALNDWLNTNGIYMRRPDTWPKATTKLNLFRPLGER